MSSHGSTEEINIRSSSEKVEGVIPEFQTLTQVAINEQHRGFIAPVTRQLGELTRLVQRKSTSRRPNSYHRTELGTTSGTAVHQFDMVTGVYRTQHSRRSMTSPDTDNETAYQDYDRRFRPPTHPKWPTRINISSTQSRLY